MKELEQILVLDRRGLASRLKNLLVQLEENTKSVMLKIVNFSHLATQSFCIVLVVAL
jgi:hypothetical protein